LRPPPPAAMASLRVGEDFSLLGAKQPRRRKTARERREQRLRAEGRAALRLARALKAIQDHRGNALGSMGAALFRALSGNGPEGGDAEDRPPPPDGGAATGSIGGPRKRKHDGEGPPLQVDLPLVAYADGEMEPPPETIPLAAVPLRSHRRGARQDASTATTTRASVVQNAAASSTLEAKAVADLRGARADASSATVTRTAMKASGPPSLEVAPCAAQGVAPADAEAAPLRELSTIAAASSRYVRSQELGVRIASAATTTRTSAVLEHAAASSTLEARAAVQHVAAQTEPTAPAEQVSPRALLKDAFEFWWLGRAALLGRRRKPTFEQFVQDPQMVKEALA
jgi:hypothetical protein